ncbi:hypothetical protein MMC25_002126 [Agyrium rufum]|nr:hypothetical protein [Agyrium rufum]
MTSFQGSNASTKVPTPQNRLMFQAFEWYVPADQRHWARLSSQCVALRRLGVDLMWIPPGCKASHPQGNGYDIYDLYDLGEFDQKATRPTKWGSKEDLLVLAKRVEECGMGLCWDAVLNHKAAADHTELCMAVEVDPKNRLKEIAAPKEIEAWIGFSFPGRAGKYSSQKYGSKHFSGTDYDAKTGKVAVYRILGEKKAWAKDVATEHGNYDYLMFADLSYEDDEVVNDVKRWIDWIGTELRLKSIRFDAVKHYSSGFLKDLIDHLQSTVGKDWFLVGEYWRNSVKELEAYLETLEYKLSLFDAPLVHSFSDISQEEEGDMTTIFEHTLTKSQPKFSVTLVMNHDTQKSQSLELPIQPWFKPLGYSLILLRSEGYPCLFYGDLYSIQGPHPKEASCNGRLPDLCLARKFFAYGPQHDYFDSPTCIGWTREGTWDRPDGLACIMSNVGSNAGKAKWLKMENLARLKAERKATRKTAKRQEQSLATVVTEAGGAIINATTTVTQGIADLLTSVDLSTNRTTEASEPSQTSIAIVEEDYTPESSEDEPSPPSPPPRLPVRNEKRMYVGINHAGEVWSDIMEGQKGDVTIDSQGYGQFTCVDMTVAVFVRTNAAQRQEFGRL